MPGSASGGGLLPGGGVCQRGCVPEGDVPEGRGMCQTGGSGPGGMGCVVSQHALRQTPPTVNRMTTKSSKNITLATTSLRPVKKMYQPCI